ncbi:toll/interleukin-1 receptor domain-containing protein [Bradyrhizobium ontarionense]|uniref:Toll/interleukin-1 receptor domain-containing protein n=1 Tax=Bradyrhizobium ontarionense TaxID=2898149 RepID=A0ABY3RGF8_9BRAD|nr:toll/interleukin-1 receptor domain-containing protein [Bradyrhizobium sp. A19]UFZ06511.1 toll/interleukin-1 receptor domain-containing protein [Bradyrhizobium sp. A19]
MPFQHPCFISYRNHDQSEIAERFITDLCEALRNELALRIEEDLFVDREGLRAGALYNPALARALCQSACMIVVYTPTYFSKRHTYCAREYRAMEALEQLRLGRLQRRLDREHGLIIPIVLRGEDLMPGAIKNNRHYYTFERFSLTSRSLARNATFEREIRNIAAAVHSRWQLFVPIADAITCDCDAFDLPSEAEIQPWLDQMIQPTSPFPFRAG